MLEIAFGAEILRPAGEDERDIAGTDRGLAPHVGGDERTGVDAGPHVEHHPASDEVLRWHRIDRGAPLRTWRGASTWVPVCDPMSMRIRSKPSASTVACGVNVGAGSPG